jgi:5-methylcytosine-specific restriction endonuclease McrA
MQEMTQCPQCGNPMPKYKAKGGERAFCSSACTAKSVPHEKRSAASKKANQTKWQGHVYKSHQNEIARKKPEYAEWRKSVFERDNYTCQHCGLHSGNGHAVTLHPHHVKPFATYPELRYEISNGISLCAACHRKEHDHVFIGRAAFRTSDR